MKHYNDVDKTSYDIHVFVNEGDWITKKSKKIIKLFFFFSSK